MVEETAACKANLGLIKQEIYRYVMMVYYYNYHNSGHHPIFNLGHSIMEAGFCPCLQVEPTQLGSTD
jgi:hypothetical protein